MDRYTEDEITIDLRQIFGIIKRYIWLILSVPILAGLIASILVFAVIQPTYRAEASLLVKTQTGGQIVYNDILANRQLVKTYREIARSRTVVQEVIRSLNLSLTVEELQSKVNVTLRGDTEIIVITVDDTSPNYASFIANGVIEAFKTHTIRIMQVENVVVIDPAQTPSAPVAPRKMITIAIAIFLGGMVGVGAAFVLAYLDNTFKTTEDVQRHLGLAVLGTIPRFKPDDFIPEMEG